MNYFDARTRTAALLLGLATFAAPGCKQEDPTIAAKDYPQEMASTYCEAVYTCQCEDYPYPNFGDCLADLTDAYAQLNNEAYLAGLAYDGSCPANQVQEIEALACKSSIPELPSGVCAPDCYAWHGPSPAGSLCEVVVSSAELGIGFSTCQQGLSCLGGVCVNPCLLVEDLPGLGEPCPELVCDTGAVCDVASQICMAIPQLPGPGEVCNSGLCDPKRAVCVAAANVCAALPTLGQACVEGQCDVNSYCGVDDVCLARPALACGLVGEPAPGDGDGDPTTGDGDGDPTGGDCSPMPLAPEFPVYYAGNNAGGSASEVGSCGGDGPEDVFSFVAPISGVYVISMVGGFDTVLYLREGNSCLAPEIVCNDDSSGTNSQISIELTAGYEILIFADGFDPGGAYELSIDLI